jgi:hypothetical protein
LKLHFDIPSFNPPDFIMEKDILILKLPTVRHITECTHMTIIGIIKFYFACGI